MGGNGSRIAVYRRLWRKMGRLYYVLSILNICSEDVMYFEREVVERLPAWLGKGWLKKELKKKK